MDEDSGSLDLTDIDLAELGLDDIQIIPATTAMAMPEMGASTCGEGSYCCSSSTSSCCS
jgi:hypothetical protein